ncbi:invasion associated locus B family protein [Roseicyclus sp.]|uniref:invasion associated locus B family protein n=1 Tax=Roseicyclus sp. TaxID=1914329 RepID=UPI001BCFA095|nr:invasion associated locus B family protein [Roseicyclus sp.]
MPYHPALRAGLAIVAIACAPTLAVAQTTGAADALPTGQTPVGATYVAETHGDWEIRCIRAEEGQPEPCQLYQLMRDSQGGAVAEFNVFDIPDEGQLVAGATIVTPLETLLTPGIRLRVDEGNWSEYPFAFCQPIGCFARLGLTEEDLTALRRGSRATVALVPLPAPDQLVQISASLSGFTAGFAALEARNDAALSLLEQLRQETGSPPAQ